MNFRDYLNKKTEKEAEEVLEPQVASEKRDSEELESEELESEDKE